MHVDNEVQEFRGEMKKFIECFLQGSSKQPRRWKLCELLLAAFMCNKVAPSCDVEMAENLAAWTYWCKDERENLIERFHVVMQELNPSALSEIGYEAKGRTNDISIFVIDWMATRSKWKLPHFIGQIWTKDVVQGWFDPGSTVSAECFLERAETFFQEGFKNVGVKILHKVIKVE